MAKSTEGPGPALLFLLVCDLELQRGRGGGRGTPNMHVPVYKMNFPKKKPMKIAAMTTRREGRKAVEFDIMWSGGGIFLILTPSSCKETKVVQFHTHDGTFNSLCQRAALSSNLYLSVLLVQLADLCLKPPALLLHLLQLRILHGRLGLHRDRIHRILPDKVQKVTSGGCLAHGFIQLWRSLAGQAACGNKTSSYERSNSTEAVMSAP